MRPLRPMRLECGWESHASTMLLLAILRMTVFVCPCIVGLHTTLTIMFLGIALSRTKHTLGSSASGCDFSQFTYFWSIKIFTPRKEEKLLFFFWRINSVLELHIVDLHPLPLSPMSSIATSPVSSSSTSPVSSSS